MAAPLDVDAIIRQLLETLKDDTRRYDEVLRQLYARRNGIRSSSATPSVTLAPRILELTKEETAFKDLFNRLYKPDMSDDDKNMLNKGEAEYYISIQEVLNNEEKIDESAFKSYLIENIIRRTINSIEGELHQRAEAALARAASRGVTPRNPDDLTNTGKFVAPGNVGNFYNNAENNNSGAGGGAAASSSPSGASPALETNMSSNPNFSQFAANSFDNASVLTSDSNRNSVNSVNSITSTNNINNENTLPARTSASAPASEAPLPPLPELERVNGTNATDASNKSEAPASSANLTVRRITPSTSVIDSLKKMSEKAGITLPVNLTRDEILKMIKGENKLYLSIHPNKGGDQEKFKLTRALYNEFRRIIEENKTDEGVKEELAQTIGNTSSQLITNPIDVTSKLERVNNLTPAPEETAPANLKKISNNALRFIDENPYKLAEKQIKKVNRLITISQGNTPKKEEALKNLRIILSTKDRKKITGIFSKLNKDGNYKQGGGAKAKGRSVTPIGKRLDISLKKPSKKSKTAKKSKTSKSKKTRKSKA